MVPDSKNCYSCRVQEICMFGVLNSKDKEIFNTHKRFLSFKKGDSVFNENAAANNLFIINIGMVKLVNDDVKKNTEYTITVFQPGDIAGTEALIKNSKFRAKAIAICDLSVCQISRSLILQLSQKNAGLTEYLYEKILKAQSELICRMEAISKDTAEVRLMKILSLLVKNGNCPEKSKVMIKQDELASLINISRETASRILNKYKKAKLLQIKEGEVIIMDTQKLNNILKSASC